MPLDPTVAMSDEVLHVPPLMLSVSGVVAPAHTVAVPVIPPAVASAVTVATAVAVALPQPLVTVYDIVVVPAVIPVTLPKPSTVPAAVLLLLHEPLLIASLRDVIDPVQTLAAPVMVPAFVVDDTVIISVMVAVPQLPLIV